MHKNANRAINCIAVIADSTRDFMYRRCQPHSLHLGSFAPLLHCKAGDQHYRPMFISIGSAIHKITSTKQEIDFMLN